MTAGTNCGGSSDRESWGELLEPAIQYAEHGFPVSEIIAADWNAAAPALGRVPTSTACFLPGGHAPPAGTVFRNLKLARSLRMIVEGGRDACYRGPLARSIVSYSQSVGGLFTLADFAEHTSTWVEPVSINYRGFDIWELPPNGQGIAVLQMLNLLERYDLKRLGFGSAETLHLMIEAKKLAYEDRARYYADMEKAQVPVKELISKAYAARAAGALIDPRAARTPPHPGAAPSGRHDLPDGGRQGLQLREPDPEQLSRVRLAITSPATLGFPLQNRGCLFALDETHPNRLEPRKRPFHQIEPARKPLGFGPRGVRRQGGTADSRGGSERACGPFPLCRRNGVSKRVMIIVNNSGNWLEAFRRPRKCHRAPRPWPHKRPSTAAPSREEMERVLDTSDGHW